MFQLPSGYDLTTITLDDFVERGSDVVAKLFKFTNNAEAARVSVASESGERMHGKGFDVLFMPKQQIGLVAAAGGFDITLAHSLADIVERYLGLNSKRMEHAAAIIEETENRELQRPVPR